MFIRNKSKEEIKESIKDLNVQNIKATQLIELQKISKSNQHFNDRSMRNEDSIDQILEGGEQNNSRIQMINPLNRSNHDFDEGDSSDRNS